MDDGWLLDFVNFPSGSDDLESSSHSNLESRVSRRASSASSSSVGDNDAAIGHDLVAELELYQRLMPWRANMNVDDEDEDYYDSDNAFEQHDLMEFDVMEDYDSWHSDDEDVYDDDDEGNDDYSGEEVDANMDDFSGEETGDDNASEASSASSVRSSQSQPANADPAAADDNAAVALDPSDNDDGANDDPPVVGRLRPRPIEPQPQVNEADGLRDYDNNDEDDDDDDDNIEIIQTQKKIKLDIPEEEAQAQCLNESIMDDDQKCPICLDGWTNAGEHRLCSLRCGHLFGLSCISQWLSRAPHTSKNCPECKAKASRKDIRVLYAKKLICLDTIEKEKLQVQLNEATQKQKAIEQQLAICQTRETVYKREINNLERRVQDLEQKVKLISAEKSALSIICENTCNITKNKIFDVAANGSCRVMAYNPWNKILAISSGCAINCVFMEALDATTFNVKVHGNPIRDIAFQEENPNYLLSVGFDKKVILTDIRTTCQVHNYKEETNLWSCCWSNYNSPTFFAGGAKGNVMEYDIRHLQKYVAIRENPNDQSPVVSLASVPRTSPTLRAGGYLVCQLNSCHAYGFKEGNYVGNQIDVQGPFLFLRYNEKDNHVLLSCRANPKNPNVRHVVCSIEKSNDQIQFNTVHSFNGGNMQKLLSRPCYMNLPNDTLVIANNDSRRSLVGWSVSSGSEHFSLPMSEDVLDTCSFEYNGLYQAVLTKSRLHLLQYKA